MATKAEKEKEKRRKKILSKFSKKDIKRLKNATEYSKKLNKKLTAAFDRGDDAETTKIAADINRLAKQEEDYQKTRKRFGKKVSKAPISGREEAHLTKLDEDVQKEGKATLNLIEQYGSEGRKSRAMGRKEALGKFKKEEKRYAGGGYVKKYANGGGIRKPRYSA